MARPPWNNEAQKPDFTRDKLQGQSHVSSLKSRPTALLDIATMREHSLLSLLELSNELNVSLDLYEIADVTLFNIMGHFGCSKIALWMLPDAPDQDAVLIRSHGLSEAVGRRTGGIWAKWLMRHPIGFETPVGVSELAQGLSTPALDLATESGIALFAPVMSRKKVVGFVALGTRANGAKYGTLDKDILQASLNLVGVALENTKLYNRMVENNRKLRNANDQMQELDALKSEFLRNMNHELRTPLTIMIAYLDSYLSSQGESEQKREHIEVVRDQTGKLEGMLINLLDFSKLMENDFDSDPKHGDVRGPLQDYTDLRRPGVTAELRNLRFSAQSDLPPTLYDRDRLMQILDCLVDNAVKFTQPGSAIDIRAEAEKLDGKEWIRIDVQDDGPGIPSDRLPLIFEAFRQGDGSETREHGGMGMGLPLARRLAERMNGRLDAQSELGKGATFTIRLPAG